MYDLLTFSLLSKELVNIFNSFNLFQCVADFLISNGFNIGIAENVASHATKLVQPMQDGLIRRRQLQEAIGVTKLVIGPLLNTKGSVSKH